MSLWVSGKVTPWIDLLQAVSIKQNMGDNCGTRSGLTIKDKCAGLNPQNRTHQTRACTRYTNQTSLRLSGLVYSLGDPELHWVDLKGSSHVTYPYWLVTQSVTSYIKEQRTLLGSCCCLSFLKHSWSIEVEEVAVLRTTDSSPFLPRSSERAHHTFRVLPWSSPTPPR